MITVRKSNERGSFNHGWLDTRHTFSFGDYYDPRHMAFRSLRVINEDRIAGGMGFGTHPHRDMEIVTYVISGALEHRDSLGSGGVLRRGDVQAMSAGTGLTHSEFNHSADEEAYLIQTWIMPAARGAKPAYDQRHFSDEAKRNRLIAIASGENIGEALHIGQDATVYATLLDTGATADHPLKSGRGAWVQVVSGEVAVNGIDLSPGDGAAIEDESNVTLQAKSNAELLLFDLG